MGQFALQAQVEVQGVRSLIRGIGQIRSGLVEIDVAESEIAVAGVESSHQISPNARQNGQQIQSRKRGRVRWLRKVQIVTLKRDAGTWNCPSASPCREQREALVCEIGRVCADRVNVPPHATTNYCLAVGGRCPGEAYSRREIGGLSSRGIQTVGTENGGQK